MKLSLIWIWSQNQEWNKNTEDCLVRELAASGVEGEILIYHAAEEEEMDLSALSSAYMEIIPGFEDKSDAAVYNDALKRCHGDYVTVLHSGDVWSEGTLAAVSNLPEQYRILMLKKMMPSGLPGAFSPELPEAETVIGQLAEEYGIYPFYLGGTFLDRAFAGTQMLREEFGMEAERQYVLNLCVKAGYVTYMSACSYMAAVEQEGDITFFPGIYEEAFYIPAFRDFWLPWLAELKETYGKVPELIQHHLMFTVCKRIDANLNNRNKHILEDGDEIEFLNLVQQAFQYVEDRHLLNAHKIKDENVADSMKWLYAVLKYGEDYKFVRGYLAGKAYYGDGETMFNKIETLRTTIAFMDYRDGLLEFDGLVHPILYSMAEEVYLQFQGIDYPLTYNERYAHTKAFGVSLFKSHSFHVSIPVDELKNGMLYCYARVAGEHVKIFYSFASHFSRMSAAFANSYWCFGQNKEYMMLKADGGLQIRKCAKAGRMKQELRLQKEMLLSKQNRKKNFLFLGIRMAYFATRPFIKTRPIWMYLDKIYKGGDSSEYLYRYASAQDNNFKHYYLVDKHATDYKRLKKDGYRPLVRGSLKHRLIFLMSDMMVISNSTVCAFNGFDMVNSAYVRDLINFHVCCVQHGMSVQKIAIAQNRLRDNTRLYFCASKYEIRNLMHPIYDYEGYGALKLTGVPRYDGLVNNDQKQIMISPTWRMQAAVPVRTSESEQRDYNPLFKESTYYKVFNALINDPRLIEAAKTYGYKIKYVLHPIVSSQVDDFDRNEYVDIIPAVGDMSYEKMFCESSLMVTDFSGIQFDFAYMRKPLVYLHHKDIPQHYEEGSFFYDTMAFGEICHDNDELIDTLTEYMSTGCVMKPEYVKRADDFFYYDDRNNCERIYREMLEYQDRYVFPRQGGQRSYHLTADAADTAVDFDDRRMMVDQVRQTLIKNGLNVTGNNFTDRFFQMDLDDYMIVLLGLGHHIQGSMYYVLEELNTAPEYEGFSVYVRADSRTCDSIQNTIDQKGWHRTQVVLKDNEYARVLETAKYLMTETFFPEGWIKKPGQVCINIRHGTPLKKMGLAKHTNNLHKDGITQRNFINSDYILYPNDYTRDHMLASYQIQGLMKGKSVMLGCPKTAGMLQAAAGDIDQLKRAAAPKGEQIFVYMPTWRDYLNSAQASAKTMEFLNYMDENLRDDQILYVKLHHNVKGTPDCSGYQHVRRFPADMDTYALLAASDALITDYSGVIYDYLALRKHIVLFCDDYDTYRKKRGTYMDITSLPFDQAPTKEAVLAALNRGKTYDDQQAYDTFCAYDSVDNVKKLCRLFLDEEDGMKMQSLPETGRRQVLVYDEACADTEETSFLYEAIKSVNRDKCQVMIGCEMSCIDQHRKTSYPMLKEIPVFGTLSNTHMSTLGKGVLQMYREGKLSFEESLEFLKYDYAADAKRMFGEAEFDTIMLYDVEDPLKLLALFYMPGKKYLFLHESMIERVAEGDMLLKDVLEYLAPRVDAVFAENADMGVKARAYVKMKVEIQSVETLSDMVVLLSKEIG